MSAAYVLTAQAKEDLAAIADAIAETGGLAPAERVVGEMKQSFEMLAENPGVGHLRGDICEGADVRF